MWRCQRAPLARWRLPRPLPSKIWPSQTKGPRASRSPTRPAPPDAERGFGVGDVVAFEEQEALQVEVVDLFAVGTVGFEARVQFLAVEPLGTGAVPLQGVKDAAFDADAFTEEVEQQLQDVLGELAPPVLMGPFDDVADCGAQRPGPGEGSPTLKSEVGRLDRPLIIVLAFVTGSQSPASIRTEGPLLLRQGH